MFARFKDEENIKAVERLLNSHTELEMFERSQLGEYPVFVLLLHSPCTLIHGLDWINLGEFDINVWDRESVL